MKKIILAILILLLFSLTTKALTIPTLDKPVNQMTISEIQEKITEILTTIKQLQTMLAQMQGTPEIPTNFTFNTNLKYGTRSQDVLYLQRLLNQDKDTQVDTTGLGSPGKETNYFGKATLNAVKRFQNKYQTQISNYAGYTIAGTGLLGPGTRTKLNQVLQEARDKKQDTNKTYCGDGIIQKPNDNGEHEVCDSTNLNNNSCTNIGYRAGTILCSDDCLTFDTSQCINRVHQGTGGPTDTTGGSTTTPEDTEEDDTSEDAQEPPTNNAPNLNSISNKQVAEGQTLTFTIFATDIDGDSLSYSVQNRPNNSSLNNNTFTFTPNNSQQGSYTITFIVSDGELTDRKSVTITVNNVETCTPTTCSAQNKNCGTILDGCGNSLNCGSCNSGYSCNNNVCLEDQVASSCGDGTCNGSESCYTCSNDCGACDLSGTTHTINVQIEGNGTVSPSGPVTVKEGDDLTFTITPDSGYITKNIYVLGSKGVSPTFTFYNVSRNYTLNVQFVAEANDISENYYIDKQLTSDCLLGNYSIANRDCSGSDGSAYNVIGKVNDVAGPGDIVLIRGGIYHEFKDGTYDVIWPKQSGTASKPITYRPYNNEKVVIGNDPEHLTSYPNDGWASIARGAISMRNVSYVNVENIEIGPTGGWLVIIDSDHINITNCDFHDAGYPWKGSKIYNSKQVKISNCSFKDYNTQGDSLVIERGGNNVIENTVFTNSGHASLAIRGSSYNVIRNNTFSDDEGNQLLEIYDSKVAKPSLNVFYNPTPRYNSTKYNLIEGNTFGYTSWPLNGNAQAMEFSGQKTIVRNNIFNNPVTSQYPDAAGRAITLRWGGSKTYWDENRQAVMGQGHEAGFVYDNKFFNNTLYGYDWLKTSVPSEDIMDDFPDYAPMTWEKNWENYSETWKFDNNLFKNNIFSEGRLVDHKNWGNYQMNEGEGVQVFLTGNIDNTQFINNNFYSTSFNSDHLIYNHVDYKYQDPKTPNHYNQNFSSWSGNLQQDPLFTSTESFELQSNSSMIDSGSFLTTTASSGSGNTIRVNDANYFYDGFGIDGEVGDTIQLEGQTTTARIIDVNYDTNNITINKSLSWSANQGIGLAYNGNAPDIGANESLYTRTTECIPGQTQSCSTGLQGVCSTGTKTCQANGNWGSCVQDNNSTNEVCGDALDNDCDGSVDEDCQVDGSVEEPEPTTGEVLTDYLSFWKFNGNTNDETGNNNGTINGDPQYVSGIEGQALDFDGDGDYIDLGSPDPIEGLSEMTISLWVKSNSASPSNEYIFISSVNNNQKVARVYVATNNIVFLQGYDINSNVSSANLRKDLNNTNWHHLVAVWNNGVMTAYLDNINKGSGNKVGDTLESGGDGESMYISHPIASFNGQIDNVMIYDRALSESEIQAIYDEQKPSSISKETDLNWYASMLESIQRAISKLKSFFK